MGLALFAVMGTSPRRESSKFRTFLGSNRVAILLAALWLIPLLPALFRNYAFEHDSVNFALAAKEFDLHVHQPHPAGFPYWVLLIRLFGLAGIDPLLAQSVLALAFTAAAAMIWRKAIDRDEPYSLFLLLLSPAAWFYAAVPSTYAVDLAFSCALWCLGSGAWEGDRKRSVWLAAAAGVWSGFRSASAVFMVPLLVVCAWRARTLVRSGIVFSALWLAWYLPVVWLSGGFAAFDSLMRELTLPFFAQTSIFFGAPPATHFNALVQLAIYFFLMLGPAALGVLLSDRAGADSGGTKRPSLTFWLLFVSPALLFIALIHGPKPGYSLILLPPLLIVLLSRVRLNTRAVAISAAASLLVSFSPYELLDRSSLSYNATRATLRSVYLIEEAHAIVYASLPKKAREGLERRL